MKEIFNILILTQLKILNRYTKLWVIVILLSLYTVIVVYSSDKLKISFNVPLFTIILSFLVTGFLFGEFFLGGNNERIFYFLFPTDFAYTVLSKNIAAAFAALLVALPILAAEVILLRSPIQHYVDALCYLLSSISVFFVLGNLIAVFLRRKETFGSFVPLMIVETIVLVVASFPYLILKVWLDSYLLCLTSSFFTFGMWYLYIVPITATSFRAHKDDIIGL